MVYGKEKRIKSDVLFTLKVGLDLVLDFIEMLKSEMVSFPKEPELKKSNKLQSIYERIIWNQLLPDLEGLETNGNIKDKIKNHVQELKKFEFSLSLNKIESYLTEIRNNRIKLWESILIDYLENKEEYEKNLRELCFNREKTINSF